MNMKLKVLSFLLALSAGSFCFAGTIWHNPVECGAQIHGHGWTELYGTYVRLPDRAESMVSDGVWTNSRHSAGLSVVFRSNSEDIMVRMKVKNGLSMFHMPSTGVSGVDLYATNSEGESVWCFPDFPSKFTNEEILCKYRHIEYGPNAQKGYEYHMYLPMYNAVEKLEIGVCEGADFEFVPVGSEKPIVIYGTSIAHGACASRPGNAWANIVARELGIPVVNLGFSGSGRLEPEMFSLLSEIDARMYIVDCMPNMEGGLTDKIRERILKGVEILRKDHDCPILLVEHSGCRSAVCDSITTKRRLTDEALRNTFDELTASGAKNVFLLTREEIGMPLDGMVEGTHPNDLGMRIIADAYERKLREIDK